LAQKQKEEGQQDKQFHKKLSRGRYAFTTATLSFGLTQAVFALGFGTRPATGAYIGQLGAEEVGRTAFGVRRQTGLRTQAVFTCLGTETAGTLFIATTGITEQCQTTTGYAFFP
jgi:sugar/nucleoside kinase (ribokinase family)